MSPAAFSPLRRRVFLQARARVAVSLTYARVHGEVWMYLKQPQVEPPSRCVCEVGMRAQRKNIKGANVRGGKCAKFCWVRTTFGVGALPRAFGARRFGMLVWREAGTPRKRTGLPRGGVHALPVRMREGANPRRGVCRRESSGYRGGVETEHKGSSQCLAPLDLAPNGDV